MSRVWDQLEFLRPGWGDLFEIFIVAILFYRLLLLIQRTRAMQMLLGALLLVGIYFAALILDFSLIRYLLETLFQYGAIAALVVFQPELRSGLARLGRNRLGRYLRSMEESQEADELVGAVMELARLKRGAIVAIQGEVGLDEYGETGSPVGAPVSAEMLKTIFTPYTPLHDGAVIIHGGRIVTAGAILPLTQLPVQDKSLGTRHRAALGLSEETDAVVVVVSEETSRISVARGGRIEIGVDEARLREILSGVLG
ncbi:MAG: diadenylate cyclase CdaA [Longimicrobiales bacterium]|nr:diadenylate cyclase CdaA [Longimicrobiales bacterium]